MWDCAGSEGQAEMMPRNSDDCFPYQPQTHAQGCGGQAEHYHYDQDFCQPQTQGEYCSEPLTFTPDTLEAGGAVTIHAPCISNFNTDALLSRVYDGPDGGDTHCLGHGKRKPPTPQKRRPSTTVSRYNRGTASGHGRSERGGHAVYVTLSPFGPPKCPKIGQIARTSTASRPNADLNHRRFYAVSRAEEIAAETAARRELGLGPKALGKSATEVASSSAQKTESMHERNRSKSGNNPSTFSVPRLNSSLLTGTKIQMAVEDLARIPEQVERIVALRMENSSVQTKLFQKATKKLNIPVSKQLYRNLPDIEAQPEVSLKRVSSKTKKPVDPVPRIEDYVTPQYSSVEPSDDTEPVTTKKDLQSFSTTDLNRNFNQLDLIRFERTFISI